MRDPRTNVDARRSAFLSRADEYERYRPGYPAVAIEWVVGPPVKRVIDVGCGPGNLTAQLAQLGHEVVGVDASPGMLKAARRKRLTVAGGPAESLPLRDGCADVVTAATSFHWFDGHRAVPEMRRVVGRGGNIGLLNNLRDETVPWVGALSEIIGSEEAMVITPGGAEGMKDDFISKLEENGMFSSTEHRVFHHEQTLTPHDLVGLVCSRSYIAILPDVEQKRIINGVIELCRDHPDLRAREAFVMPYKTLAFRSFAS